MIYAISMMPSYYETNKPLDVIKVGGSENSIVPSATNDPFVIIPQRDSMQSQEERQVRLL